MDRRSRTGTILVTLAVLLLGTAVPGGAQSPKEVTESLCKLFDRKQVRQVFGQQVGFSKEDPGACHWGIVDRGKYGGSDLQVKVDWEPFTFDDLVQVTPGATETTVAGRRALFSTEDGEVLVPGEGPVMRTIYSTMSLDLDQGPLRMLMLDTKGRDRLETLTALGELAVANAARVVAPPPLDQALASLVPATIDSQPTVIQRVLYPSQVFCSRCDFGKALRALLKEQGKSIADVSMLTAETADESGPTGFGPPAIRALRVEGMDAGAFVEPMIGYLFGGSGVTPERTEGTGVIAVTRRGDQYNPEWTAVLYPRDDILWVVTASGSLRDEILGDLPGAPVPPPIPTPAPTPTPDISTPEGYLKSLMPGSVGGEALSMQSLGAGWIANFDKKTIKWAQAEVKKVGKKIEDLSSMVGFNNSGTQIMAMRVPDVDVTPLVDLIVGSYRSMGALDKKTKAEPVEIAGRSAFSLETLAGTLYLYPKDDILWLVQVPDNAARDEVFAALP